MVNLFLKQVGSSAQAIGERQGEDYYETEPAAIDELLKKESFNHFIWEPACGKRSLSRRLEEHGYEVRDSDIVVRPCDKPMEKLDFMECLDSWDGDIITNPPFKIATDFILHALGLVKDGAKVAMFLRLQFLEGRNKYRRLYERFPPKAIYIYMLQTSQLCEKWRFRKIQSQSLRGLRMVRVAEGIQRQAHARLDKRRQGHA